MDEDKHSDEDNNEEMMKRKVTWEIREGSFLYNMFSVKGLQNFGASEALEATLDIVIIPFERLCP